MKSPVRLLTAVISRLCFGLLVLAASATAAFSSSAYQAILIPEATDSGNYALDAGCPIVPSFGNGEVNSVVAVPESPGDYYVGGSFFSIGGRTLGNFAKYMLPTFF
jgi:hypothetical protein